MRELPALEGREAGGLLVELDLLGLDDGPEVIQLVLELFDDEREVRCSAQLPGVVVVVVGHRSRFSSFQMWRL
jgi:hypothetical protein